MSRGGPGNDAAISCDVLVIGGGAAGVAAAAAAGSAGARVVLLERYGFLGGLATAGQVGTVCGLYLRDSAQSEPALVAGGFGVGRRVDAGVDADAVAGVAAEELVDGDAEGFRGDVPQAVVDGGDGGEAEGAWREAALLGEVEDEVFDAAGVLALDEAEEVVE